MHCSTGQVQQDYGITGILYDVGSVYERLTRLTDLRKAKGKLYALELVLLIVVMAKLCGEDKPMGIAEWAQNRQEELAELLKLNWTRMPSHHTYRRILAHKVYVEEVERLVGEYNQHGKHGEVYAMDGKVRRGMRKKDEEGHEYCLSIYDVAQAKVVSQVEVGRKENEIVKAPKALKLAEISQKVITADAMHTQRGLATQILEAQSDYVFPVKENQPQLYKNIQSLFAPEYPKPGFGKIQTDFLSAQKVNKGHGRIELRTIITSEMLNTYAAWPGLAQVYRLERKFQWRRNGRTYRTSCEVEFGITSLTRKEVSPQQLLQIRRTHWGIETGLHYRRDVTLQEDATRMTVGDTGKVMASINNLVLALIRQAGFHNAAQARRWFAAHLSKTFALLTTLFSPS
jgi:predicted transposase YbfD/YdcC